VKASAGKPNLPCGTHTFEKAPDDVSE